MLQDQVEFNKLSPIPKFSYNVVSLVEDLCSIDKEYKKIGYKEVHEKVDELYFESGEYYSCAMDILAIVMYVVKKHCIWKLSIIVILV